jgi:hypothetical protein
VIDALQVLPLGLPLLSLQVALSLVLVFLEIQQVLIVIVVVIKEVTAAAPPSEDLISGVLTGFLEDLLTPELSHKLLPVLLFIIFILVLLLLLFYLIIVISNDIFHSDNIILLLEVHGLLLLQISLHHSLSLDLLHVCLEWILVLFWGFNLWLRWLYSKPSERVRLED